ncbi:hypothetical protein [Streptomyces werraensis]|uniref:hypothetical protein n=1 Tax=Streptomyces werraensis TaxID=68284 RepID=UPI0037D4C128
MTTAVWPTVRSSERPTGNRSSSGSWVRLAVRAPLRDGCDEAGAQQQEQQRGHGQAGQEHGGDAGGGEQVAAGQDPAGREAVGERGQGGAADGVRREGADQHERRQQRGSGALVDEDRQGHLGGQLPGRRDGVGGASAASFPAVETVWAANTARVPGARSTAR